MYSCWQSSKFKPNKSLDVMSEDKSQKTEVSVPESTAQNQSYGMKLLTDFYNNVLSRFLSPSVITVVLTAILGPIAINWVNQDMKKKELQQQVIEKMLNYTAETDFSKPESLEKVAIIARMVGENKEIFNLSFEETDSVIQNLYGEISKVGLANLNKKRREYEDKIKSLKTSLEQDTVQLPDLRKRRERLDPRRQNQEWAAVDLQIRELENKRQLTEEQIKYWQHQIELLDQDINQAQKNLAEVLEEKRVQQQELSKVIRNRSQLEENYKKALDQIRDLNTRIQGYDSLSKAFERREADLLKQIEELEDKLEEMRESPERPIR